MKRKGKQFKPRNRIERQIAREARSGDVVAALDLAQCGHKRSKLERAVGDYLRARKVPGGPVSGFADFMLNPFRLNELPIERRTGDAMRVMVNACHLCRFFLDAVDSGNVQDLWNLAEAVRRFKDNPIDKDPLRSKVVTLKAWFAEGGQLTATRLAGLLGLPRTDVSYSHLRRVAKSVGFPLAKDKIGRPKKPVI